MIEPSILFQLATRAGVPPGVINVVTTQQSQDVGKELCENKTVKKVTFTGSTPVAKILMRQAASTLKKYGVATVIFHSRTDIGLVRRVSFEAGGNAPFIVFDDADIDKAVDGVIASKFRGSGQTVSFLRLLGDIQELKIWSLVCLRQSHLCPIVRLRRLRFSPCREGR